jgi:hypothetical protein
MSSKANTSSVKNYIAYCKGNNNHLLPIFIFCIFFSVAYTVAGLFFYEITQNLILRFFEALFSSFITLVVCSEFLSNAHFTASQKSLPNKLWLKLSIVLLASYSLCFITYFPGVGMNDGLNIMLSGMSISQQFPPLYCGWITFLTKIGHAFGNLNISIAIYSITQLIAVALITGGITCWIWQNISIRIVRYTTLLFYACEPLVIMYSFSMLKDTLFSLLIVVFMILSYELSLTHKNNLSRNYFILLAFTVCGIIFLRNNGKYIVLPCLFILFFKYRKNKIKKALSLIIAISIASVILNSLLMYHWGAVQLFQEIVGIPLQQVAATAASDNGVLTDEQKDFINEIMPLDEIEARYSPSSVDPIKWSTVFNSNFFESHRFEFMKLWASLLIPNFDIYVKAYLQQTYWFWAPRQEGTVECYFSIENYSDNSSLISFTEENDIHDCQLLPNWLNSTLRSYYSLASSFLREGVCFWLLGACFLLTLISRGNFRVLYLYLPCVLLWLTIMVSTPVNSSLRYVFTFVYALPVCIAMLFSTRTITVSLDKS